VDQTQAVGVVNSHTRIEAEVTRHRLFSSDGIAPRVAVFWLAEEILFSERPYRPVNDA
jgi:hypothetical protein